jgi:hypothetical protein
MARLDGKWVQDSTLDDQKIRLRNDQHLRGRNNADSADINVLKVNTSDLPEFGTQPQFNGSPSTDNDLVNRGYVLSAVQGIRDPKDAVRVASTGANIDISSALINGATIDGVVVATGDRVLLKDQTAPAENGIYDVVAAGAASRSTDADEDAEVTQGMSCLVAEGTLNARRIYVLTTADPITVDTTGLSFAQAPNPANFLVPKAVQFTLGGGDLVFIDLAHLAEPESIIITPVGGVQQEYNADFTVAPSGGVSRITWAGDLATLVAIGDELQVYYSYEA